MSRNDNSIIGFFKACIQKHTTPGRLNAVGGVPTLSTSGQLHRQAQWLPRAYPRPMSLKPHQTDTSSADRIIDFTLWRRVPVSNGHINRTRFPITAVYSLQNTFINNETRY